MTDKKFLLQLNLYLDGEIDPAGAAALEQEILSDPARRRIYNDYCRIHRATKLVYEQFRAAGAGQDSGTAHGAHRSLAVHPAAGSSAPGAGRFGGGRAAARPFRNAAFMGGIAAACTVGAFIGAFALSSAPTGAPPTAPAVAAGEPAATTTLQAITVVTNETATFTAPFATGARPDPYLVQFPPSRTDPFALTLSAPLPDTELARLLPVSVSGSPLLKVDPRFQPATHGFDRRPEASGLRDTRSFRIRLDERAAPTAPYEFSVEQ